MQTRQIKSSNSPRLNFYVVLQSATLPNMNELKGIPHRFWSLAPERLLCGTVPFQSKTFKLSIRRAVFKNNNFSEQLLFRTAIFHNSYLIDFWERLVFREAISQNSLSDITFFTFASRNMFISLK